MPDVLGVGKKRRLIFPGKFGTLLEVSDKPELTDFDPHLAPPILLCVSIAMATALFVGGLLWVRKSDPRVAIHAAAAMSNRSKDLRQVIQLKQIYAAPPVEEDPSQYPKRPTPDSGKRNPARNAQ